MKKYLLLFAFTAFLSHAMAQSTSEILKQQAGQGVREGARAATETTADKVTNKLLGKLFSGKKKKQHGNTANQQPGSAANNNTSNDVSVNAKTTNLQTYSKYDFVPGEKVLVYEDFSQDAIGDFPENWNTNSAGETVTASDETGHWLMLNKRGVFLQQDINNLPDNFTYEFDLIYTGDDNTPELQLFLVNSPDTKNKMNPDIGTRSGVILGIQRLTRDQGGYVHIYDFTDGAKTIDNQVTFSNNGERKLKVSIWRQKQRMRVYINQNKMLDLPHAFSAGKVYNTAMFKIWTDMPTQDKYLLGNIKLAAGDADTRARLITEGKFSTTGILFDVNSATIKPESYGSLKDIADVLQASSGVRIKIIGYTDNDGDGAMNLVLSKKRAAAVKSFLQSNFNIDPSRMETDGMGATEPVADNNTPVGKAQNRRVEFVKL